MNEWDEKIYRDSVARDLCPGGFEDQEAFTIGARWQREALLADDVIERAARALDENFNPDEYPIMTAVFRDYAKTALEAAIEGDE